MATPILELRGLVKSFGGVKAVSGLDMTVNEGEIHALIGPNGSGKTTTLNVISGLYRANEGSVRFRGDEISQLPAHTIAQRGITRTFQNIRLFSRLTVLDNVMIGRHTQTANELLDGAGAESDHLGGRRCDASPRARAAGVRGACRSRARARIEPCLWRSAAARDRAGTRCRTCAAALGRARSGYEPDRDGCAREAAATTCAIAVSRCCLIEHDMNLVMSISDRITVLNFGTHIAEGAAAEISQNPDVITAYLGGPLDAGFAETR